MNHPIHRVTSFAIVAPYRLRVTFDDATAQVIDFAPVLEGAIYGPLREATVFNQVSIDPEVHTLIWPNGADFDPATLHDWPQRLEGLKTLARRWKESASSKSTSAEPAVRR